MKISNTITKLLTVAVGLAAMVVIGSVWMTEQAGATGRSDINSIHAFQSSPIGFIHGQTLRFSLFNPKSLDQGSEPVRASAYIYDSTGRLIAQTGETAILPGQFHSFDFHRDALSEEGEAGTGRLQVRGVVQVLFSDGSVRTLSERFPLSIEVIDSRGGGTQGGDYFTGSVTVSSD